MAFKRTIQRQTYVQPVQNAPSSGDMAMANSFGDLSTLFGNMATKSSNEEQKKFATNEMWRAFTEAPTAVTNKDGALTPNWVGSLVDKAKNFSSDSSAQMQYFKIIESTINSQITSDINAKGKELFTNDPANKKNIEQLRVHVNGVKSVWKDSPTLLASIDKAYNRAKEELTLNVNNKIADNTFMKHAVESEKAISIITEQVKNLAYHNKTPQNNEDSKQLFSEIQKLLTVYDQNPKTKPGASTKIMQNIMKEFAGNYYKGIADRLYMKAENDNNSSTDGLDQLNKLKLELNKYDGTKPLPFGFTKEMAINAVDTFIGNKKQEINFQYTRKNREDQVASGVFLDEIQLATNGNKLDEIQRTIMSTTFNQPGTQGKLLKAIASKKKENYNASIRVDKKISDEYSTDINLINIDKPGKHQTYAQILDLYTKNELPPGFAAKFVIADNNRNKLQSSKNILSTETLLEGKFTKPNELNTPEKLKDIIDAMPSSLPSTTDKTLIIKSQNSLYAKLERYKVDYEKMVQQKNKIENYKGTINSGGVIEGSSVKELWDIHTNGEGVNFDSEDGQNDFLTFVAEYKHFPPEASLMFNSVLLSGNIEEIIKVERLIMASHRMLMHGDTISSRAAKERIYGQLKSGDSNSDSSGRVKAFLEYRFADVPIERALEFVKDGKMQSGNSKIKGMAANGVMDGSSKEDVIAVIHNSINGAFEENNNFVFKWLFEISGFGNDDNVKSVIEYYEQFGDTDIMKEALMQTGLKDLYYNAFLSEIGTPGYENDKASLQKAALAVAIKLRGTIGFATTPLPKGSFDMLDVRNFNPFKAQFAETNDKLVRFVKNPITTEFNKTLPPNLRGTPDMDFYKADILSFFEKAYFNKEFKSGQMRNEDALFAIKGGHLVFHAKERYGNRRYYEVYGLNKDRQPFKLMDSYNPNYHDMEAKKAWNEIQDSGVKTVLGQFSANITLIGLPLAQQSLQNFLQNKTQTEPLVQFIDFVSKTSKSLGLPDLAYGNLNDQQKMEFRTGVQRFFNLIKPPNIGFNNVGIGVQ